MMQPTLPQKRLYNIVPDSGLQFLDFGFSSEDVEKVRYTFAEIASEQETVLSPLRATSDGGMETFQGEPVQVDENAFTVKFPDALDVFSNTWLPLPFLKQRGGGKSGQRFEEGPTNWVRFRITPLEEKDENGYDHRLTLLIDTATGDRDLLQSYVMPLREDVENEAVFGFASDVGQNAGLLKEAWMEQWLNQHLERYEGEARLPRQDRVPRKTAGWAMFVTLLEGLNKSGFEPQVKLVDTVSEGAAQRAIDVDLVLDIGNCRTCGVLIEKRPSESGRLDLKNAQPLRLRDFTDPVRSYADPFQSDVEFRRTVFGDDRLSRLSGRPKAFSWPSLVRVGPEAARLNAGRFGSEGASGLSAPKRYLWDESEVARPWLFNTAALDIDTPPMAVFGDLRRYLSKAGDALSELEEKTPAAMEPLFSRSSLFSLMLIEVVYQAFMQINSVGHRRLFQPEGTPRRLARVIVTIPTGTPLVERQLFEKRARHARSLLLELLGDSPAIRREDGQEPLEFSVRLDEATCTQITYLYGLISDRFQKQSAQRVFRIVGRPTKQTLRIASFDIGGGTTDLMVSDFDTGEDGMRIRPVQIFREGFRRAGDDLLRAVISHEILPAFARQIETAGVKDGNLMIAEWMRAGGTDDLARQRRKLFTGQILRKLGLAVFEAHEKQGLSDDYAARSKDILAISAANVLAPVDPELISAFERDVADKGGEDFRVLDLVVESSGARLEDVIAREMDGMFHNLCRVVNELNCDVLLVSGRPSRLPAMLETIRRHIPVSPHRVVPMNGYRVGNWNPFARGRGRIEDPKTTVVVGALIATLGSEGGLEEFDIDLTGIEENTTARVIGTLEGNFLRDDAILFDDVNNPDATESLPFSWSNTTFLGFRQIANERWPATPLYRLSPQPGISRHHLETRPWRVTLTRDERPESDELGRRKARAEKLTIEGIEQAALDQNPLPTDVLELRLQTMADDEYWLDTGFIDFQGAVDIHDH